MNKGDTVNINTYFNDAGHDWSGIWTSMMDMHSGGSAKTKWGCIFIQASEELAIQYANWRWNIHPDNVACTCCGEDFSVYEQESILDATRFYYTLYGEDCDDSELAKRVLAGNPGNIFVFANEMGKEYKAHEIVRHGYRYCEW